MMYQFSSMADVSRLATASKIESGSLSLGNSERLKGLLVDPFGTVNYQLRFFSDIAQRPCVHVSLEGSAHLLCQRSLDGFSFPLKSEINLGFIGSEDEEASLMPGFDPILIAGEPISLESIVEDELILMIPQVPIDPSFAAANDGVQGGVWQAKPPEKASPFANLSSLLKEKPPEKR